MIRHKTILQKNSTGLLIIDIQERINAVMKYRDQVIENTVKLIKGFQVFNLPIFVTEQYPEGLGSTEPQIVEALHQPDVIQKMTFSCCGAPSLMEQLQDKNIQQIVICGIETHVCVQQTVLDLLEQNFQVYLIRDAISSRKKPDHKTAIERMRQAGVIVTTTEAVLFELLEESGGAEFKKIYQIIK